MTVLGETNTFFVGDLYRSPLNRPKNVHIDAAQGFPQAKSQGGIIRKAFLAEIF